MSQPETCGTGHCVPTLHLVCGKIGSGKSTLAQRLATTPSTVYFLDVGDDLCKARLKVRNAAGDHPFKTSEAEFELISRYFEAPAVDEGFEVVRYE